MESNEVNKDVIAEWRLKSTPGKTFWYGELFLNGNLSLTTEHYDSKEDLQDALKLIGNVFMQKDIKQIEWDIETMGV